MSRGPFSTKIIFFFTASFYTGNTTTKLWNVGPGIHFILNPQILSSCQNKPHLQEQHMSCIALFRKCLRRAQVCINKLQQSNADKWMESQCERHHGFVQIHTKNLLLPPILSYRLYITLGKMHVIGKLNVNQITF